MMPCPCCAGFGYHESEPGPCGGRDYDEDPEFGELIYGCVQCTGSGTLTEPVSG